MKRLLSITLILASFSALSAEDSSKLPKEAQTAIDASKKTQDKLADDYKSKVNLEREKLYNALDKLATASAKKGDVDGAIAIKEQMKKLVDSANKEDETNSSKDMSKSFIGTWHVLRQDGHDGTWEILDGGIAKCIKSNAGSFSGNWKMEDNDKKTGKVLKIIWNNNSTQWEIFNPPINDKMIGDGWNCGKNSITATRIQETVDK